MIPQNVLIGHYKRKDVQEEMLLHARSREMAVRFEDKFGSRPDMLNAESDILENAKQGATSFHCSEELWRNPLQLKSEMTRQEQDNLRSGWDLVIDVDCPVWEYSKLITHFIIQALRENGVTSISCKFSGNKGFHIGVPFEAFPKKVGAGDYSKEVRLLFPDGVRIIAAYLVNEVDKGNRFSDFILKRGLLDLLEKTGTKREDLIHMVCRKCETKKKEQQSKMEFICTNCNRNEPGSGEDIKVCNRCGRIMEKKSVGRSDNCLVCKGKDFVQKLDVESILSVDAVLISSRHLYRMPYSLHEKSGLVSIPINPDEVLKFEREMAKPETIEVGKFRFIDRSNVRSANAAMLFDRAFHWHLQKTQTKDAMKTAQGGARKEYTLTEAIPEDLFPPCIKLILNGITDGRKRAVFVLINFYRSCGYDYETIEIKLNEWNKKNTEPLREINIKNPIAYHKQQQKQALPPNCQNAGYMLSMGVCKPDNFCSKIKNPAQYAKKKAWLISQNQENSKPKQKKAAEKK
jgi:DNA primase catalytic subunit